MYGTFYAGLVFILRSNTSAWLTLSFLRYMRFSLIFLIVISVLGSTLTQSSFIIPNMTGMVDSPQTLHLFLSTLFFLTSSTLAGLSSDSIGVYLGDAFLSYLSSY